MSSKTYSKIHEFETTHLKSMAGTGVGAILTEESAFLNPASLAFFTASTVYAQKDSDKYSEGNVVKSKPKALGFVLTDANPTLSGSLSYVTQEEENISRKRWGLSLASPVSDKSAFGISIRQTNDEDIVAKTTLKYYQTVLGVTHSVDEKFSIGIVAYDPLESKGRETKALIGLQYVLLNYITGNFDFGGDYTQDDLSKTLQYKAAMQIKVLDDFFLRVGGFSDKARAEKGSGFGLAWIQPRLSFEFAIKNTKRAQDTILKQTDANFKETSFAASIRF